MDNLIPKIDWPRIVTEKHEVVMVLVDQGFQFPAARRVKQQCVVIPLANRRGCLISAVSGDQREEFHREVRLGFELGQFLLDAGLLFAGVLFRLNAAPVAPTGAFAALRSAIGQHRLHAQRLLGARWPSEIGSQFGRLRVERGHGESARGEGAHAVEELAAAQPGG